MRITTLFFLNNAFAYCYRKLYGATFFSLVFLERDNVKRNTMIVIVENMLHLIAILNFFYVAFSILV